MSPEEILNIRRNHKKNDFVFRTETFDFSKLENSFRKDTRDLYQIMNSSKFKEIVPGTEYKGKNREMYETVGEYYIMTCVSRIFNSFDRKTQFRWINILCTLFRRGFLTRDIIIRIERYISQKRMPVGLRCIIRLIIIRYSGIVTDDITSAVGEKFHNGVDKVIVEYVF